MSQTFRIATDRSPAKRAALHVTRWILFLLILGAVGVARTPIAAAQALPPDAPPLLEPLSETTIAELVNPPGSPDYVPEELLGLILFRSDMGPNEVFALNPENGDVFMVAAPWVHKCAEDREKYSASREYQAYVKQVMAWENYYIQQESEEFEIVGHYPQYQIHYYNHVFQAERPLTFFGLNVEPTQTGDAWDPAWSPREDLIAMTANEDGDDNIYIVRKGEWPPRQLTVGREHRAWDKHPSWSLDGSRIVFSSSRTGARRLWIMDADGGNQRQLSGESYEAWDPSWVKYVGRDGCPGLPPATAAPEGLTPPLAGAGTVNHNANLRAGPGTDNPVIGSAAAGTSVVISATNAAQDWLQLDSGAWIAAFLVDRADAAASAEVPQPDVVAAATVPSDANVAPTQLTAYVAAMSPAVESIFAAIDAATELYAAPKPLDTRWLSGVTGNL